MTSRLFEGGNHGEKKALLVRSSGGLAKGKLTTTNLDGSASVPLSAWRRASKSLKRSRREKVWKGRAYSCPVGRENKKGGVESGAPVSAEPPIVTTKRDKRKDGCEDRERVHSPY